MTEEWRPVKDFPEYQISNLGRVKSLNYNHTKQEQILKHRLDKGGYSVCCLSNQGIKKTKKIHRLIGEAFLENTENKPTIDHIDRNKQDNHLDNLRWATHKEQIANQFHGLVGTNTGEPYISYNVVNSRYYFQKKTNKNKIQKNFKTLEEAVAFRDSLI